MKAAQLATLRFFALLFLLPGLAGLIVSAAISTHYADTLPRLPAPQQMRIIPRNIAGIIVYQTIEENSDLNLIEGISVAVFVFGLVLSAVYLEKWGSAQQLFGENEREMLEHRP